MNDATEGKVASDARISDDAALVERVLRGDSVAEHDLYERLKPTVWMSVTRVLGPGRGGEWEDACQIAFLRLFDKLYTWRREASLATFAAVVATRVAIDMVRSPPPFPLAPDNPVFVNRVDNDPDPAVLDCLKHKFAGFSPAWRMALKLKSDGLGTREIADRLAKSIRTIQSWVQEMYDQMLGCLDR